MCLTCSREFAVAPVWRIGRHLHELRHTGASLMLAQGTDLSVVSEVLGHPSVAITKDVYGHLVEGQKRAAAQLMSSALMRDVGSQIGSHDR